jgi:hypothetical protein
MGKYLAILKAIAQGNHSVSEIAAAIIGRTTSLPVYLDFLQMTELIRKIDNGYQLTDPFLEFWLKACLRLQESTALSTKEKLSAFHKSVQGVLSVTRSQLGKAREAQVREMFFLSPDFAKTGNGIFAGEEFDLITYKENKLILGEIKLGDVTLAEVLKFTGKLERIKQEQNAVGFLFILETIYPDALNAALQNDIEIWDLDRINSFRKKLKLEKLTI